MYATQSSRMMGKGMGRSRGNTQVVYGVGTKKCYGGQQTAVGHWFMRVMVAMGIAAATAGAVLLVAAL